MQKRAPNRRPQPLLRNTSPPAYDPHGQARVDEAWRKSKIANYGFLTGIDIFQPNDSYLSIRRVFDTARRIEDFCAKGDIDALKPELYDMRNSSDPIMNRPGIWAFWDREPRHFQKAYENNHWHIIEYLAQETPFRLTALGEAVAERALQTESTTELEKILDLGWDINMMVTRTLRPPTLSRVITNEKLVRWYLSHGADPNATGDAQVSPMLFAAREASLEVIQLLVAHGGNVVDSDLIAQAAIGHSWGRPDRMRVIEYLLEQGADIDGMALDHWQLTSNGGQTAFNVAQISRDAKLAKFLISKGANQDIQPINTDFIEEFPYLGEHLEFE